MALENLQSRKKTIGKEDANERWLDKKNNIPIKSNEFSPQEASFWPAIYTLLCVKSFPISAVSTCFWRVKSRKQGFMTIQKTHKQLCVSEIQKMRMLGVFAPQDELVIYTPKIKRQGVKKKFIRNSSQMPFWQLTAWHESEAFSTHLLNTSLYQIRLTYPDFTTFS